VELTCVTLDCAEPRAVATFWSAALGWDPPTVAPDGSSSMVRTRDRPMYLEFVRVPERKAGKNRLHLGCDAGSLAALDRELGRLLALGASVAWEETFPPHVAEVYRNVVVRDVEGNEFCLSGGTYPSEEAFAET
jgi:Glyoxalase-like domain